MRRAVEFEPVPAITWQRPFAISTVIRITCSRSPRESVGDSPVVPTATTPLIAVGDLPFDQTLQRGHVDFAIVKRGDKRSKGSSKHWLVTSSGPPALDSIHLKVDRPFENKIGGTGKRYVRKLVACAVERDLQFVPAAHQHPDRAIHFLHCGKDKCARHHASSAGQRFIFHAAFVGANGDLLLSALLSGN